MLVAGIVLIVIQVIGTVAAFIGGKNPFSYGFAEMLGYFLVGIIGVILVISSLMRKRKKPAAPPRTKKTELSVTEVVRDALKPANTDFLKAIPTEKYSRMFRRPFDSVIHSENCVIGGIPFVMLIFSPAEQQFNSVGGFSHLFISKEKSPRYFASEHSFDKFFLCEWVFDGMTETKHINYGEFVSSIDDITHFTEKLFNSLREVLSESPVIDEGLTK